MQSFTTILVFAISLSLSASAFAGQRRAKPVQHALKAIKRSESPLLTRISDSGLVNLRRYEKERNGLLRGLERAESLSKLKILPKSVRAAKLLEQMEVERKLRVHYFHYLYRFGADRRDTSNVIDVVAETPGRLLIGRKEGGRVIGYEFSDLRMGSLGDMTLRLTPRDPLLQPALADGESLRAILDTVYFRLDDNL